MPEPARAAELAWETLLELDDGPGSRRERLERAIRAAVDEGRLPPGAALPPSRALAETLGVSRWVVTEAYGQLVAEGFLEARVGSATRVPSGARPRMPRAPKPATSASSAAPPEPVDPGATAPPASARRARPRLDLGPGVPDLRHVPRARWAAAVRTALAETPDVEFALLDPLGHPAARAQLAAYLARSRRAAVEVDRLAVVHGAADAVARLAAALARAGHRAILVEDPSWPRLRELAASAGLTPVPVPVDGDGIDVERLAEAAARTGARAAIVTPAHQFPLGSALSPARREALVAWARAHDAVVVEDDYDAEFRYDRRPIAALQALAPERVVLVGSLSKTVSPAYGLGWAVLPAAFVDAFRDAQRPSVVEQLALARFIERGDLERHLRAARVRLRRRRAALAAALEARLPELAVTGLAAGMHLVLELPEGVEAVDAARRARAAELAVSPLSRYRVTASAPRREALVLGYGNLSDALVDEAVARLARVLRDAG